MYRVKIDDFDKELSKILEEYADNITEGTQKAVEEAAKVAKQEAKSGSPVGKRGRYQKGWSIKKKQTRLGAFATVYNRTDYQLTHLLEKGHALRGGGRSRAIPHIAPAEKNAIKNITKAVEKIAKG